MYTLAFLRRSLHPLLVICYLFALALSVRSQTIAAHSEPNTTTAADSVITFNEIMYHPLGNDSEWLELYNQMSANIDISGWEIDGGIEFRFPTNTVFYANTYVIVAANPEQVRANSGATNVYGPFTGRLSSSGETLRLRNQSGRLLDEMTYADEDPWPVGADGSGASLSKRDRFNASSPAANWRASAESRGTPGRVNFATGASNEVPVVSLIVTASDSRWIVPENDLLGTNWITADFDDTQWHSGKAALGYDTGSTGLVELVNVALNKPVIAGSGAYSNNPFDVPDAAGNFIAQNVTDGSTSDLFGQNYWLGREGTLNESFTLDLGQSVQIEEIHLRNTHNTQHNDRGTDHFEIWASQSVDASRQLVNPTRILAGNLTDVDGLSEIPADRFTPTNGLIVSSARYLRFIGITANNSGNNIGLNEIEVYAPAFAGPNRSYTFNGTLNDSSGSGANGQNLGAQFSSSVPPALGTGQSLAFDGVASQVQIADAVSPSSYTIALWVKVETVQSSSIILRTDAAGPANAWSHQLRINGSGRFEHYIFDGTGRSVSATNIIVPGNWYHLAITAASAGSIRIYVNGELSGGPATIGALWAGGTQWRLGSNAGNAPNFFKGNIDEMGIWHSVLDVGAIRALASGRPPAQLGGYHRFFTTDVEDALFTKNSSLLVRLPFESPIAASYESATLRVRYADGFVAFLNGFEIARRNAPQSLAWNSTATLNREDSSAINFESIDLSAFAAKIGVSNNVLAVHGLNSSANDPAFLLSAELIAQPVRFAPNTNLTFSEISGATNPAFFLEIYNQGAASASLAGCSIRSSNGGLYQFPSNHVSARGFFEVTRADLGFPLIDGERLFLLGRSGDFMDAVEIHNRPRGRTVLTSDGAWFYVSAETAGQPNSFSFRDEVVINEIMYHHAPVYRTAVTAFAENDEQWIELYNRSDRAVDLTGWRLDDEIEFVFPTGTILAANSYLVVANEAAGLRAKYPNISIIGNFDKRLSHHSGRILLRDPSGNPADEVRYQNSHPWPSYANGGGSTLELRDPRADNAVPEAWSASSEHSKANWRRYTYQATAVRPTYSPAIYNFHEFRMGLLDEGEVLVDNITVREMAPNATPRQLLQNTDFSSGTATWRLLGNHSHSFAEPKSEAPADSALHLVATGSTSYLDNRLETTLKFGASFVPVVTGYQYEISFDAKWLGGSPQLRTELYYNKVAATTILDMPAHAGTPGTRNSTYVENAGPTYYRLAHSPVIPKSTDSIEVGIEAIDPDGLSAMRLFYLINAGAWRELPMTADSVSETLYRAVIPPQASGAVIQFYVHGTDSRGATSTFPAAGPGSRALIKVDSQRLIAGKQTFRTIMLPADSTLLHSAINMMSDDLLGCTVVHNEQEVFYDARIRLHGSMFSRSQPSLTGMTIKFPAHHRFRGSRESVIVRRRGLVENIVKHLLNSAGGLPGNYDDVVHLVSHRSDNLGTARLNLANYDDTYVDANFEGDDDGTVFKLEGIREYQTTQNGSPEGLKLSQPIGWIQSFDIANLGNDHEQYRWGIMIQSDRKRDDYSRIVAMAKAFSLSGAALKEAAGAAIDVNEWARLFALQSLLGIGDVYGVENPHNFAFYVRPSDGRVVGLQNDWEFAFNGSTSSSIYGSMNVYKVLQVPGFKRIYQGHLMDLIDSVANSAYITPWARHYSTVMGENYNGFPNYLAARGTSVRSQLAARIPFEITSGGGAPFPVTTPSVTLQGRGWIDVHEIYHGASIIPLEVTWLDDQRWQTTLPLNYGTNLIELVARNYRGLEVGGDAISIVTTASEFAQRDYLRISEVMYHPAPPQLHEANAGFTDADDFEFIELVNTSSASLSLLGVRFTNGIAFNFTSGTVTNLAPFGRVVLVSNKAAFEFRYGTNLPVAGEYAGNLSNGGELLRLIDRFDGVIHEFFYGDGGAWPSSADGGGRSLTVRDFSGDYSLPSNWQASSTFGGTPGRGQSGAPLITSLTTTADGIQFSFLADAGVPYDVFACDDLGFPVWTLVRRIPPGLETRTEQVVDTLGSGTRFYRIAAY